MKQVGIRGHLGIREPLVKGTDQPHLVDTIY